MKIAKLLTWHWGSLEDREWIFADTVLLTGESGSGKSTLLDAIQTVSGLTIVGCDINELSPVYDQSGVSTAVACKVLRELLLAVVK